MVKMGGRVTWDMCESDHDGDCMCEIDAVRVIIRES